MEDVETIRRTDTPAALTHNVVVVDAEGRLAGCVSVAALLKAAAHEPVGGLIEPNSPAVSAETDVPEIARLMTDYNLMSMPVIDGDGKPIGLLAVDDVLELMLPADWRRRFGLARD